MPVESTKAKSWKKQWCRFINAEFRAWIKAMLKVEVSVLGKVRCGKGVSGPAACVAEDLEGRGARQERHRLVRLTLSIYPGSVCHEMPAFSDLACRSNDPASRQHRLGPKHISKMSVV